MMTFYVLNQAGNLVPARFRRGLICSFALILCAFSSDDPLLFSSAISPDGVWIAENFGTDGCCDGGFVLIHKISERSSRSDAVILSPSPSPGVFMIWQDDTHLSLVGDTNDQPFIGPAAYKGITIAYSTYRSRINFDVATVSKKSLSVKAENAFAETTEELTKTGRRCGLSISVADGAIYDKVGTHIDASINRCNRARDCAGIHSEFWIGKRIDGQHGIALTSATVSGIPSYNRLPKGDRNSAIRGSFGGNSAVDLITALASGAMDIQYSLNFFDTILSYRIETRQMVASIASFRACIGDGDFNWLERKKVEPKSSEREIE